MITIPLIFILCGFSIGLVVGGMLEWDTAYRAGYNDCKNKKGVS